MDSRDHYNHMLQSIKLHTYELNKRVNWAQLNPDGTNPHEGEIAPLENHINKVFSNDAEIGVLKPQFWSTLTEKQQKQIFAEYDEVWDNVQQIRRSIQEAYNQLHHGAPRETNMDLDHDESGDEAEGDIHGMGLHGRGAKISLSVDPVRVIDDKHAIAQYVKDHESEMKKHCPQYSHIIDAFADEDHILIVYEELGRNEGFAFTYIDGNYPTDLYLALLCADKGRGIGTILLSRVEDVARQLNLDQVALEPADAYALQFYEHNQYILAEDNHMYKQVKPMEARPAVAPPPVLEPEDDEADMGSGLPDRGRMFHKGLNRRPMLHGGMMAWKKLRDSRVVYPHSSCSPATAAFIGHYLPKEKRERLYNSIKAGYSDERIQSVYDDVLGKDAVEFTDKDTPSSFQSKLRWGIVNNSVGYLITQGPTYRHILGVVTDPDVPSSYAFFDPDQETTSFDQTAEGHPKYLYHIYPSKRTYTADDVMNAIGLPPLQFRYMRLYSRGGGEPYVKEGKADPGRHGFFVEDDMGPFVDTPRSKEAKYYTDEQWTGIEKRLQQEKGSAQWNALGEKERLSLIIAKLMGRYRDINPWDSDEEKEKEKPPAAAPAQAAAVQEGEMPDEEV